MKHRAALIGIVVEDTTDVAQMNNILTQHSDYIIGRMGIPYRKHDVSIISIVLDAPDDIINSVSGKIGMLKGITTKTVYSKFFE